MSASLNLDKIWQNLCKNGAESSYATNITRNKHLILIFKSILMRILDIDISIFRAISYLTLSFDISLLSSLSHNKSGQLANIFTLYEPKCLQWWRSFWPELRLGIWSRLLPSCQEFCTNRTAALGLGWSVVRVKFVAAKPKPFMRTRSNWQ